ncbi:MAG: proton-conducting transporter membrane subunit [candidate division KSB1 bacterium]|nr:proton-conducting transporter membrane subunit [candidate division KSB1 bacterium]
MVESLLPVWVILLPVMGSLAVFGLGFTPARRMREALALGVEVVAFLISANVARQVWAGARLTSLNMSLYIGGLNALMLILVHAMVLVILVQAVPYMRKELVSGRTTDGRLTLFYALVLLFAGTMSWTVTTNNMVMLYVAMEGSTLATALLVAFYRARASLEAGYKYVLLVVTGMTFSLFGIILVYAAGVQHLGSGRSALMMTEMGKIANAIPKDIALMATAFMTCGFATKAGLVPFHAWLPDAHAEAPTPISALLSGLVIKIGAYALVRTVTIFAPHYRAIVLFIAILTSVSMVVGIVMALVQDDLKRLLAYSSVSQISYVFEGLGLGTYLGIYGGLFHLVNHTIIKALLFLSVGSIMYATGGKRKISELGGLAGKMPITAVAFFIGALSIGGLPPFNGFMSKFTIFLAVGEAKLLWAAGIGIFTGMLTISCLVWAAYRVFWRKPAVEVASTNPGEVREVPVMMWVSLVILATACVVIGLYPQVLYPALDAATRAVLQIWAGGY